ncbi:MAG: CHAT domain-containing protein [Thermoanaerobaculia bacterium]
MASNRPVSSLDRRRLAEVLAVLAMVGAVMGGILWERRLNERLVLSSRAVEGRLVGVEYAPLAIRRSTSEANLRSMRVLSGLGERLARRRTAANLRALASAYLSIGMLNSGSSLLVEALRLEPDDPATLNDLAVHEFADGRFGEAAERFGRLLHRDPTLHTAWFNWALSMEQLSNRHAAIEAWRTYLVLDPGSGWAAEARSHLAALEQPRHSWEHDRDVVRASTDADRIRDISRRRPQRVRELLQTELLPNWVERRGRDDEARLRVIATTAGDTFLLDVLESSRESSELQAAWRAFGGAHAAARARQFDAAAVLFEESARGFDAVASPMAFITHIRAASNDYYRGRPFEALRRLDRVDARLGNDTRRYACVAAESGWVRGLVQFRIGRWNESLQTWRRALEAARNAREIETEVAIKALIAGALDRIGDPAEAERYRLEVLRELHEIDASRQRIYTAYAETTWTALRAGRPHVAMAFIDPQRKIAEEDRDPLLLAETSAKRALALRELGDFTGASAAAALARSEAAAIETKGLRDRVAADIDYVVAILEMPANPRAAIAAVDAAIELWDEYGWRVHSSSARLFRGEAHLVLGDRHSAETDFREAIEQIERERSSIDEPPFRVAFFERADRVFERLIELLLEQGRTEDALTIVERKRSRALLDRIAALTRGDAAPMAAAKVAAAVRPGVAVVEMTVLDRGVAVWVVRRNEISFAWSKGSREAIEQAATRQLAAIDARDDAAIRRAGRDLYDGLLSPLAGAIENADVVVIVSDGSLRAISFAALVTPDGRYWIERTAIGMSPSSTVYLRRATSESPPSMAVVVAQSAPAQFERLPRAEAEARGIASLYPTARTFIGAELAATEFLLHARLATTVHFAGHARVDLRVPSRSALVFESTPGRATFLMASDIAASRLARQPVVVLAACSTGRGKIRRHEGVDDLANAFLHAGASTVVATLWDVDDSTSAVLFLAFHQNLRRGESATSALRNAQLSMLRSADPYQREPAAWANTVVIGSI